MQIDIQLFFPQWQKKPLPFVPLASLKESWPCFHEIPQRQPRGQGSEHSTAAGLPADTINPLAANSPLLKKMDVCSWAPQHLSAVLLSLKVQGSTAAEHLSTYCSLVVKKIREIISEDSWSVLSPAAGSLAVPKQIPPAWLCDVH